MVSGHQRVLRAVLAENCETPKLYGPRDLRSYDQRETHMSAEGLYENKQLYEKQRMRKKDEDKQCIRGGKRREENMQVICRHTSTEKMEQV